LRATVAVMAGTPPTPATVAAIVAPGPTGWENPPVPVRVSRMRAGVTPTKRLPLAAGLLPSLNQPPMSAITWVEPAALKKLTQPGVVPLLPTLTITRFGTVCPATKLRLEAVGCGVPV